MGRRNASADSLSVIDAQSTVIDDGAAEANGGRRSISLRNALRFKWTILLIALMFFAIGEAAVWTLITPIYRASAVIEVQPIIPRLLDKTDENGPLPFYQQYLDTQIEFITSDAVLNRVLDRPEVRNTRWYAGTPANILERIRSKQPPIDRLRQELEVVAPRGKLVIQLFKTSPFAGEARTILNAVAHEYTQYVNETRFQQDKDKLKQLKNLAVSTGAEIDGLEAQLTALQDQPDLQSPDLDKLISERKSSLESDNLNLETINREIESIEAYLAKLGQETGGTSTTSPSRIDFSRDERWRQIKGAIEQSEISLAEISVNLGSNHPSIQSARNRITQLTQILTDREAEILATGLPLNSLPGGGQSSPSILESTDPSYLNHRLALLIDARDKLTKELQGKRETYSQTWQKYRSFKEVRDQLHQKQQTLKQVEKREFEIEQNQKAPANIRRVGDAFEPQAPDSDRRPKFAIVVLFGALAAGVAAALFRYMMSPKVYELKDVAAQIGALPVLGYLPLLDQDDKSTPVDWPILQEEAVREIRTALMPRLLSSKNLVLQITSSSAEAGKTFFSLMLARSFAASGKRVLLVDADLRRSSLSQRLECNEYVGLSDLLGNSELQHSAVRRPLSPGLDLIPAGAVRNRMASELLANGMLSSRITNWRQAYDVILIDSSPILATADGSMLAQQVDSSIVLIREGHCNRHVVGEALTQIEVVGGQSLGIVLVGPRPPRTYYYGRDYIDAVAEPIAG